MTQAKEEFVTTAIDLGGWTIEARVAADGHIPTRV